MENLLVEIAKQCISLMGLLFYRTVTDLHTANRGEVVNFILVEFPDKRIPVPYPEVMLNSDHSHYHLPASPPPSNK